MDDKTLADYQYNEVMKYKAIAEKSGLTKLPMLSLRDDVKDRLKVEGYKVIKTGKFYTLDWSDMKK